MRPLDQRQRHQRTSHQNAPQPAARPRSSTPRPAAWTRPSRCSARPAPRSSSTSTCPPKKAAARRSNGHDYDGEPTYGGYSQAIVVKDRFVVAIPERSASRSPRRCSARGSRPSRRCGIGTPARARGSASSGSAGSATSRSRSLHAMGAEVTVLSRRQQARGRSAARRRSHFATSDRATSRSCAALRPDPQHGLGEPRRRPLPEPAAGDGRWSTSARRAEPTPIPRSR